MLKKPIVSGLPKRFGDIGPLIENGSIIALSLIALFMTIIAMGIIFGPFDYRWNELNPPFSILIFLWIIGLLIQILSLDRLGSALKMIAIFLFFSIVSMLGSSVLATISLGYADKALTAADAALFPWFDWQKTMLMVGNNENLGSFFSQSYANLNWQPLLLIGYFCCIGRQDHGWKALSCLILAASLCILLFPLAPATGGYVYYGIARADVPYVHVAAAWDAPEILRELKNGTLSHIGVRTIEGIVTMPSFHAAASVVLAWSFWQSRLLRWPMLAANIAMFISSVPIGSHYIVDLIAGSAIACFSIVAVPYLQAWSTCQRGKSLILNQRPISVAQA
ncbi:MAG: hypothetical protein E2598_07170 [Sphingobium sp.]|nr:hypothetical protein [Sphingobium sp.]